MTEISTRTPDPEPRGASRTRRISWRGAVVLVVALLAVIVAWSLVLARSQGVVVAPHANVPIRQGETVLWCAVSQLAWDALADVVGQGTLDVGSPAPADVVRELNRRSFPHDGIDAASIAVCSGIGPPGPGTADQEAFNRLLGTDAPALDAVTQPDEAYAYAGLAKDLPFDVAFKRLEEPLRFSIAPLGFVTGRRVEAFGWTNPPESQDGGPTAADAVTVLFDDGDDRGFALEIRPRDASDRLVLARVEPSETLAETWDAVVHRAKAAPPYPISEVPLLGALEIPRIALENERAFPGFTDAPVHNVPAAKGQTARIRDFREWVRFRLDERGAELKALSGGTIELGWEETNPTTLRDFRFDRSFLLALRRANAPKPYFLMWVGNVDVLVPVGG